MKGSPPPPLPPDPRHPSSRAWDHINRKMPSNRNSIELRKKGLFIFAGKLWHWYAWAKTQKSSRKFKSSEKRGVPLPLHTLFTVSVFDWTLNLEPVSYKRYFRCNCFLLLMYTINLSLSEDFVDPPPMGTFYMKHALTNQVFKGPHNFCMPCLPCPRNMTWKCRPAASFTTFQYFQSAQQRFT